MKNRKYIYGVRLENGKPNWFIQKSEELPYDTFAFNTIYGTHRKAEDLAQDLLKSKSWDYEPFIGDDKFLTNDDDIIEDNYKIDKRLYPGKIVCHTDGGGHHFGVLLKRIKNNLWQTLFLTSNPFWGQRELTKDEIQFFSLSWAGLNFKRRTNKATYWAPVVRNARDIIPYPGEFPEYRVKELMKEFK